MEERVEGQKEGGEHGEGGFDVATLQSQRGQGWERRLALRWD